MKPAEFLKRRTLLMNGIDGAVLLLGHSESPRNYPSGTYPFRQNSHFLYYVGQGDPDLAALLLPDGTTTLFGLRSDTTQILWTGPSPSLEELGQCAGITRVAELSQLPGEVARAKSKGLSLLYLPPFRDSETRKLSALLHIDASHVEAGASGVLAKKVASQRVIKGDAEVAEIERALAVSGQMYDTALSMIAPGVTEMEISGAIQGVALRQGMPQSFLPIVTVRGEVLHNQDCSRTLETGQLLLIDSGAETRPHGYASDITRTFPVSGRFLPKQKDVYDIVLAAQQRAIATAAPGVSNVEVHLAAVRTIVDGLKALHLITGNSEDAAEQGAHTLFFPHGIGHLLGLDVHDMEDLGPLSGLVSPKGPLLPFRTDLLRFAAPLQPGCVITVEPGIYFIPALAKKWRTENLLPQFINYAEVEKYLTFGGIRIEDDILITSSGARVLGPEIPKTVDEIESRMAQ